MTNHTDERVLVIPAIFAVDVRKGFCTLEKSRKLARDLINSDQLRFMPRSEVEDDPRFLQLIPYVILYRYDARLPFGDACKVFTYQRGSAGGESRLIGKRSLGIGGHINDSDATLPQDAFHAGVFREIDEEVSCTFDPVGSLIGTIYDDTDAVGRVHLGVVISFRMTKSRIEPKDKSLIDPRLYSVNHLLANDNRFENWSQLVIDMLRRERNLNNELLTDQPFVLPSVCGFTISKRVEETLTALRELQTWLDDKRDDAAGGEGSFEYQDPAVVKRQTLQQVSQKIDALMFKIREFATTPND